MEKGNLRYIAIVHPIKLMRHALRKVLADFQDILVTDAMSLDELCERIPKNDRLDLILFNVDDVKQDTIKLACLRSRYPKTKILALSRRYELEELFALFKLNIDGALLDDVSQKTLTLAFRLLEEGQKLFPSNMAQILLSRIHSPCAAQSLDPSDEDVNLSQREQQILYCLENGESNKAIANELDISEATVKVHVKSILRKIGASNRTQAAIWSLRQRANMSGQPFFIMQEKSPHRSTQLHA
ncbi:response regulator transcription factor [Thalassospira profundimaris]|uniref:LuxR C-terminal-related transcriptional regulator n=1 Tax=Thalassospira profundimaris TaxID=502049 RepID=UPI000DED625A|nr:response regulator transcription factor [Thalassospira profundimaris]